MYKFEVKQTISTPHMLIDEQQSFFMLTGESFPENVIKFYEPLTNWLKEYIKTAFGTITFECHLVYFNSSTSKLLMNILSDLDNAAASEKTVVVNWHSSQDNDIIIECGEEFGEDFTELQFNIIVE